MNRTEGSIWDPAYEKFCADRLMFPGSPVALDLWYQSLALGDAA